MSTTDTKQHDMCGTGDPKYQKDDANNCLIDDIPKFDNKPELHFDYILKLENKSTLTK